MTSLFDASAEQELKQWLIDHLRDKCPADPTLLADYVLALLRDTDKESVGGTLKDQLSEFLGDHVTSFVSEFMSALDRGLFKEKPKSTPPPTTTSTTSTASSSSSSSTQQTDSTKRKRKDENDQEYSRDTKKTKPTPNKQQDRQTKGYEKSKSKDDYDNERRDNRDNRKDSKYDRDSRDSKYDRDSKYKDRDSRDNRKDSKYDRDSKYDKNDKRKETKRIEGEIIKDSYGNNILVLNKDILSDPTSARLPSTNTLMLTGIPPELNRLHKIYFYFKKFGPIVNIMVKSHNHMAFVQFENKEDAQNALQSPDAILGNRFIQAAWSKRVASEMKVDHSSDNVAEEVVQKTVALQKTSEITKKNEDILTQQLSMYQSLEKKLESLPEGSEKRKEIASIMKSLSETIESSLETQKTIIGKVSEASKPKQQQQLEFFKKKQEELKEKSLDDDLKQITEGSEQPTKSPNFGNYRGRGGYARGRGRGGSFAGRTLSKDNRTSTLYVTGLPEEKMNPEAIQSHFSKFGAVDKVDVLTDGACLVKYSTRADATKATQQGSEMEGKFLKFMWKEDKPQQSENSESAPQE